MREIDIAKRMASGELPPLVMYENHLLAAIRVTGTKAAMEGDKSIYRKPEYYLNDDFLQSINGVSVIFEHPDNGEYLSHDEYQNRNVGSSFYPYIKDSEVWTIARIYDNDAIEGFKHGVFKDTSPAVAVIKSKEFPLQDGSILHVEGEPIYTDHIALLVSAGVWSKSLTNLTGIPKMDKDNPQTQQVEETPPSDKVPVPPVEQTAQAAEPANDGDITSMLRTIAAGVARTEAAQATQASQIEALQAQIGKVEKLEVAEAETKPKMDAVEEKIQSIEQNLPAQMSDDDKVELADTVEKTNHVFRKAGVVVKSIPSDTIKSFVSRAIEQGKQFHPLFKDVPTIDLVGSNNAVMMTCHAQILASVEAYANTPEALPQGGIVEKVQVNDAIGRTNHWRVKMSDLFRKHSGV